VRALTRSPDSPAARALAERGAQVARGEFADADAIRTALDGVWGAYSVQNTWTAGVEQEEADGARFAELAREAGVEHFVYSSVASADRATGIPHFENKWRVEEAIQRLGFSSWTVVRPVFFMENFLGPWFKGAIDEGKLTVAIAPHTPLQMIAVADIGRHLYRAFDRADELGGQAIDIAGDELTMPQTAAILSTVTGHPVEFAPPPIAAVREASEDYAIMLEWFDRVGYDVDIDALAEGSGIRPQRFTDWARQARW
jgi:uncharacterized protein YbjT (DUF2867 family)